MPVEMEKALKKESAKKGLKGERKAAYIYGTIAKWKKKQQNKKS